MEKQEYMLAVSDGETALQEASDEVTAFQAASNGKKLPEALQKFYDAFKDKTPGEYTWGLGGGVENFPYGPLNITIDNVRISAIFTQDYESATVKNLSFTVLQGYGQLVLFNRFYASCVMIGKSSALNAGDITSVVLNLSKPKEEREEAEDQKIAEAKLQPSFFAQIYNDPINEAKNTSGLYIVSDTTNVSVEAVFQAVGIADFADNAAFGLAIGISANVNTFTDKMSFTVAASLRLASSKKFTIAGEIGLVNGKLNAIALYVKAKIPISTAVYITQGSFSVNGFQEPKIAVGAGIGLALGSEIEVPAGLGALQKALFPDKNKFCPLELSLNGQIDPMLDYFSFSGKGIILGSISVSGSFTYNNGDIDAEVKAGLVRNKFLNGSLSASFHTKSDGWNLHGNFNCSVTVDFGSFFGVHVSGGLDILFNSQDYTLAGTRRNKKDLTITVSGMGKVKVLFSFSLSIQKTWVFHLSDTALSDPNMLMKSFSAGDTSLLEDAQDVLVCESRDIVENQLPRLRSSGNVIEAKSWQINEQCSKSGLVRIQVAAEYTLADSNWRLTYTNGETVTVYTSENAGNTVTVQEFTHSYYELLLDTPEAGNWTVEILGDSKNSGGIYLDALQDEKFETSLEILEQTDTAIRFRYSAFTGSADDTTAVRLFAEEISTVPGDTPYSGIIAYLEETENGEFLWEIPEDFRNNAQYRFYISAASSHAGNVTESNGVEVYLARQKAELECSWELAYDAENTNTITAYITITNTGAESTAFQWQILDYTNNNSVEADENCYGNTFNTADIIASGDVLEIKGNSSIQLEQIITVTEELRDNPSSLYLVVRKDPGNDMENEDENYADDADEILFTAMESENSSKHTIFWQAVDGAASYILHYALEGDWENSGVYVKNILDTSYVLSVAPGEYTYRVLAMDSEGKAIGSWSNEQEADVLFLDEHTIHIDGNMSSSRSQVFSLNDGIYDLNGVDLKEFTGTLTLFRNDLVKTGEENNSVTLLEIENDILTLEIINGTLKNPVSGYLLDHGDYFWEWSRSENISNAGFDITLELSGEVFSVEQKDREIISIGEDIIEMPLVSGVYVETLEGEVGFCNQDAIYQYMTDDGGELSLSIKSGTVFESDIELSIYVQNSGDGEFDCVKTLRVTGGEYTFDTVILAPISIKNNFYVQIVSPDDGRGEYNTEYNFELSFDVFEDTVQSTDILEINGEVIHDWIGFRNETHSYLLQIEKDDHYAVRLQGDARDAILKICTMNGTVIEEKSIGANGNAFIDDVFLESGNYFVTVDSIDKGEGEFNTDYILSALELKTLYPKIDNSDDTLELATQKENTLRDTNIENWVGTGDSSDFFKFALSPKNMEKSSILLTVDDSTALAAKDGLLEIRCCDRFGQELEMTVFREGQWRIETTYAEGDIYIHIKRDPAVEDMAYSIRVSEGVFPGNLSGNAEGISWDAVPGVSGYIVEYSRDGFSGICRIETLSSKVDFLDLPSGNWQWRVKAVSEGVSDTEEFIAGGSFTIEKHVSNADGNMDIFFANATGTWADGYAAEHTGISNIWNGTGGRLELSGKNQLGDIFEGSNDANILLMTDDENGDALFLEDIYTALPGTVAEQQARIAQIDEIRAGLGDDIIDMTSRQFAYTGNGVKIYGGLGNDTIWANNGSNTLFGDAGNDWIIGGGNKDVIIGGAGNDSMHGGGGEDIFCFGENFGRDTIEQLASGSITLWFASGSESCWDSSTLTYTNGNNSIRVMGISAENITLIFGDDDSLYDELAASGAFADAASEKIFEDKDKGFLA